MELENTIQEIAVFHITTANGREPEYTVRAKSNFPVDLTRYKSPFSIYASVKGTVSNSINGLDDSAKVQLRKNGGYQIRAK